LARLATRVGLSPIPLYLLGGLAFGNAGLLELVTSEDFIETGADLGVILLLLMLGLEYGARELVVNLRSGAPAGLFDLVINFGVGFGAGVVLGFGPIYSLFLGGVIYISSSGVIAKTLDDLGWLANRETPVVLSILVFEDLAMAVILPILGALAIGGTMMSVVGSVTAALVAVALILAVAASHGDRLSDFFFFDQRRGELAQRSRPHPGGGRSSRAGPHLGGGRGFPGRDRNLGPGGHSGPQLPPTPARPVRRRVLRLLRAEHQPQHPGGGGGPGADPGDHHRRNQGPHRLVGGATRRDRHPRRSPGRGLA